MPCVVPWREKRWVSRSSHTRLSVKPKQKLVNFPPLYSHDNLENVSRRKPNIGHQIPVFGHSQSKDTDQNHIIWVYLWWLVLCLYILTAAWLPGARVTSDDTNPQSALRFSFLKGHSPFWLVHLITLQLSNILTQWCNKPALFRSPGCVLMWKWCKINRWHKICNKALPNV